MRIHDDTGVNSEKKLGYIPEISLLELLNTEDYIVKQLNTARHALVLASKTSNRLYEYKKNVRELEVKLIKIRSDIQDYMENVIGVKIECIISTGETTEQANIRRERMINSLYEKGGKHEQN